MGVHVDRCLDDIVAGGVQISGLHATVAPRRQQLQSPPTLEEFAFVPYVETRCLGGNGKLAEQLRVCRGTVSFWFLLTFTKKKSKDAPIPIPIPIPGISTHA